MKRAWLIGSLMLVAGCAGPRPQVPPDAAVTAPANWRDAAATATDGAPASDWWSAFGDPAMTQTVQEALAHNDDVAIAAERVEEARAQFHLAQAQRLPEIDGGAEGGGGRGMSIPVSAFRKSRTSAKR